MLALLTDTSPVSPHLLDVVTPENYHYAQNPAGDNEEEEVDIIGKSFSFPQLTPAHEVKQQPCPVAHAALPGLFSARDYRNHEYRNLGGKKRSEKKDNSANRHHKKHRISFAPEIRSNKLEEGKKILADKEEEEEDDEEAHMEVQIHPTNDTIATTVCTPYSTVQQKQQKRGKKNRRHIVTKTAEMAKQRHRDTHNEAEYSEIASLDDAPSKNHHARVAAAAATAELQTAVQQARAMLPFPIPAAGLLVLASIALQNDMPGEKHNNAYVIRCLHTVATLIPALAAEIARQEQQKKISEVGAGAGGRAPNSPVATTGLPLLPEEIVDTPRHIPSFPLSSIPGHITVAAGVAPQKDKHGVISLQGAALNWQQQQKQQHMSFPQPRRTLTIDDPMDELNLILGIE
jgi:hypothetical protein